MCDKKQTIASLDAATECHISDREKFVLKGIIELIPDWETNETLKKNLPKILETAKKTKERGFNFMTGEIDIFDDADVETERERLRERQKTSLRERQNVKISIGPLQLSHHVTYFS